MEETKALLRQLLADNDQLRDELIPEVKKGQDDLAKSIRNWAIALIVVVVVAGVGIWRFTDYATCSTDRTRALNGPGNDRVSYLLDAFKASALDTSLHLKPAERSKNLAMLRKDRARFPVIPKDPKLAKLKDSEILVLVDAIKAIDAQDIFDKRNAHHPVCNIL